MPYNELVDGVVLPCRVGRPRTDLIYDATGRFVAGTAIVQVAQAICDKLNEQYYMGLVKAEQHQRLGAWHSDIARASAMPPHKEIHAASATQHYAAARDILGIDP